MRAHELHLLVMPSWYPTQEDAVAGSFFREQAIALRAHGLGVRVAAPEQFPLRVMRARFGQTFLKTNSYVDDGVPTYRWAMWGCPGRYSERLRYQWFLRMGVQCFRRYVEEQGMPDLIHAHSVLWGGALAEHIRARFGVPFVVTEHSSGYREGLVTPFERHVTASVLSAADVRTYVSPQLGAEMEAEYGQTGRPWKWTPNLVNPQFRPRCRRPAANLDVPFIFLSVGMLVGYKGYLDLLHAFAMRFLGDLGVQLRIVGEGPLHVELYRLAEELGISQQITFLGLLSREAVLAEMQAADALVHPSPYETFGVVLIEALACGLPVVAASEGGPETIIHERSGLLVPPRDHAALADAMVQMRENVTAYCPRTISEDCQRRFGTRSVVEGLVLIYREVLSLNSTCRATRRIPLATGAPSVLIIRILDLLRPRGRRDKVAEQDVVDEGLIGERKTRELLEFK